MTPQDVKRLCARIAPLLVGQPSQLQGAVLADLLATWLAGHVHEAGAAATDRLREELLGLHLLAVRALVPENDAAIRQMVADSRRPRTVR